MANPKVLDRRRKSISNIRKITRTMELIATARFKKAMDRAVASSAYTKRVTQLVADLANAGLEVKHPLLEGRAEVKQSILLVLTSNRGLCGGYNSGIMRGALARIQEFQSQGIACRVEVSGKRGISALKFRGVKTEERFTHFDEKVRFDEVALIANRYLDAYALGNLDRVDVAYMKFLSSSRQAPVVETLLPLGSLTGAERAAKDAEPAEARKGDSPYEFLPSAASILEEVVPASFRVRLFKCFLDAAVSEQIARMVAMKSATENADKMIKQLSTQYNRARQSQITSELLDLMGGVEALKN